jgi:hypothetical protein
MGTMTLPVPLTLDNTLPVWAGTTDVVADATGAALPMVVHPMIATATMPRPSVLLIKARLVFMGGQPPTTVVVDVVDELPVR